MAVFLLGWRGMVVRLVASRGVFLAVLWGALIVAAIAFDGLLHALGLAWVGLWLGPIGTFLVVVSFAYSLRKRGWIEVGSARLFLRAHEALAWTGALLILVHAGVHFHALLPWLAVTAMLIAVASGLMGEFLLASARERLGVRARLLRESGLDDGEIEQRLYADALVVRGMETWRVVHLPIAINFGALALLHIATALVFW
jgi:hypothetical protein